MSHIFFCGPPDERPLGRSKMWIRLGQLCNSATFSSTTHSDRMGTPTQNSSPRIPGFGARFLVRAISLRDSNDERELAPGSWRPTPPMRRLSTNKPGRPQRAYRQGDPSAPQKSTRAARTAWQRNRLPKAKSTRHRSWSRMARGAFCPLPQVCLGHSRVFFADSIK